MKHLTILALVFIHVGLFAHKNSEFVYDNYVMQTSRDTADTCLGVNIIISDTVWDVTTPCKIHIGVTGGTPPYTFIWTGPNGYSATTQNVEDVMYSGVYTVVAMDSLGCYNGKAITTWCGFIGISEVDLSFSESITIFPNPNSGKFRIEATDVEAGKFFLTMRNVIGQTVFLETFFASSTISKSFELKNLPTGIYFLEIRNEDGDQSVKKVVVD